MGSKVKYQVGDALHQPFRDGQFDLIWSMESGEHMPDKAQFISELTRVCKPGGKILIVTWCHRCVKGHHAFPHCTASHLVCGSVKLASRTVCCFYHNICCIYTL